jgi:carboxypeptidase D
MPAAFKVDGKKIPDVDFDVGESYAGLMPISADPQESRKLFFWFFPTKDTVGKDEITIWLNGGPGCSSFEGLLQENGPFLWQPGTFKPVKNPWSWTNLTNMIFVEQPVGTGFSQGVPSATNEREVAAQFLGFFKQFLRTFGLFHKKIYIAGESYAGFYVPYIADAMFNERNTSYYDIQSTLIYDPVIADMTLHTHVPAVAFLDYWAPLFGLDATFMASIRARSNNCGYTSYLKDNLVFPPKGPLPAPPDPSAPGCNVFWDIFAAASVVNPCFNIYNIATMCPLLWDVLGFPGSLMYVPPGATIYFNRDDVKRAIHAPLSVQWGECAPGVLVTDTSPPSSISVLPSVIERSKRTIIGQGMLDMRIITNGTLLAIQNMTWHGVRGFQHEPKDEFFVPSHPRGPLGTLAGEGVMGVTHTERNLTWVTVQLAGHMYGLPSCQLVTSPMTIFAMV